MRGENDIGYGDQTDQFVIMEDMAGIVLVEQVSFFLVNVQTGRAKFFILMPLIKSSVFTSAPRAVWIMVTPFSYQ